ncbi:MAG: hypothetical protein GY943_30395 [Chloroflexi bacterium]|nr:hypothetical protein [Chloroflexota bacterium]
MNKHRNTTPRIATRHSTTRHSTTQRNAPDQERTGTMELHSARRITAPRAAPQPHTTQRKETEK